MNKFQEIFDKQKAYFDSDATKSYEWRIDQLTRLENLCNENAEALEAAMSSDFKTASQEKVFEIMAPVGTAAFAKLELKEWMKPVDVVVPKALRELAASMGDEPVILKIERIRDSRKVRLRLSGEFRSHHLDQVKAEISRGEPIALDLEEVDLVDIEAIRFLNAREDEGISVLHCSPYIQEWMSRERQEEKARTDWR